MNFDYDFGKRKEEKENEKQSRDQKSCLSAFHAFLLDPDLYSFSESNEYAIPLTTFSKSVSPDQAAVTML